MSSENDKYSVDKDSYEGCLRQYNRIKAIVPQMNIQMRNHKLLTQRTGELEHAVKCRSDHYANKFPKTEKKVYAIEQVPEDESPTEDSESDSMGDSIREKSDDDQYPREELLVGYQEETQIEIQDIQLEAGMPYDTSNKSLCKHTQDAQSFLVTPSK
ncbi:hypothetical protein O181_115068 [Austropuccinia psidii MF-1]|uniref:Uncharacterized protein n=1 Tax=Austropuccinia psidii MF-1 TaxID=1389203 RepID=A0A9Q3K5W3_9BASI|nr:hypothetical protein [Austropuccinia psidii MF-1]